MQEKLMSEKEVAEVIGVSRGTIKNWRDAKLLSFFRAPGGRRPFYYKEEVDNFIKQNTTSKRIIGKPLKKIKRNDPLRSSTTDEDWRIE